jgi:hypothetical protein
MPSSIQISIGLPLDSDVPWLASFSSRSATRRARAQCSGGSFAQVQANSAGLSMPLRFPGGVKSVATDSISASSAAIAWPKGRVPRVSLQGQSAQSSGGYYRPRPSREGENRIDAGRSSDSRAGVSGLLIGPPGNGRTNNGNKRGNTLKHSITAAGPFRICTGFPVRRPQQAAGPATSIF